MTYHLTKSLKPFGHLWALSTSVLYVIVTKPLVLRLVPTDVKFLRSLLITHLHFCHGRPDYRRNSSRSQCCACLGQVVETPTAYCLLIVSTCLWTHLNGVEVVAEDILCLWHGVRHHFVNNWLHSALALLVGRQERHPACKKLDVGLLVVTISPPPSPLTPIKSRVQTFW